MNAAGFTFLDPHSSAWSQQLDEVYLRLDVSHNPTLLPRHFVQATLPKMAGKVLWLRDDEQYLGAGFLLPRRYELQPAGKERQLHYTLRYHALNGQPPAPPPSLLAALEAHLAATVTLYLPTGSRHYTPTHTMWANVDIGRPNATEAAAIPRLHQEIWSSTPEFLYPSDLHCDEFELGSTLVARVDRTLAGFLFGFHKFCSAPLPADWNSRFQGNWRLESQLLGVLPAHRGTRIASLLKMAQGHEAWSAGIGIVNWTADPLQFPNAALNFGLLRAVAFDFYPDYYPFRNALNRVPASRLGLTWLVGSSRVRQLPIIGAQALILDLTHQPDIIPVNQEYHQLDLDVDAGFIAIEIPANWTLLQQTEPERALHWRNATDLLFQRYLGLANGQYVLTGVGVAGEKRYLIGEQVGDALWTRLSQTE
jgi:predicted GNAT superfamily acetyltransferase